MKEPAIALDSIPVYRYAGEKYADVAIFFRELTQQSGADVAKFDNFANFLRDSLMYLPNPDLVDLPIAPSLQRSGLGLLLPADREQFNRYRDLNVYSDVKLSKLFDAVLWN